MQARLRASRFYVYKRQKDTQGNEDWLQVGSDTGHIVGWVPADKVINWAHTMVGAFTNPAGRERSLFMKNEQDEKQILLDQSGGDKAKELAKCTGR